MDNVRTQSFPRFPFAYAVTTTTIMVCTKVGTAAVNLLPAMVSSVTE